MDRSAYRLGLLLTTISAVAWSTTGLFTRMIPLDSPSMLVGRGLFGAIGLIGVIALLQGRAGLRRLAFPGRSGWIYASVGAVGMIFFITSLRFTTVAHVSIIYATVPLIAAALAWFVLAEVPSRRALAASLVALTGVVVMVGLGHEGGLFGDLLALGMTIVMAVLMVMARRWPDLPTLPAVCLSALLSALVCLPFGQAGTLSLGEWAMLAAFGITNSALGLALFIAGSRLLPPIETALIGALDAPLAPVWVWLVFAETPGRATLLGGAIVFAAVGWHILQSARRRDLAVQPPP